MTTDVDDQMSEPPRFIYRNEHQAKADRELEARLRYRAHHDREGNYFAKPNRAQRRHIANTWRRHPLPGADQ